ncbi:MAG: hypothetical protein HYZ53_10985 [Planctomycetes bacterium]|nr:hypothetical protein [Planctomycetota bacterium]
MNIRLWQVHALHAFIVVATAFISIQPQLLADDPPAGIPISSTPPDLTLRFDETVARRALADAEAGLRRREVTLLQRCKNEPKEATAFFAPYASDPRRDVRWLALHCLCAAGEQENLAYIVDALAVEADSMSVGAMADATWNEGNEHVRKRGRELLRKYARDGNSYAARVLAKIGTPEDFPAIAEAFARAQRGEIPLLYADARLQEYWEKTKQGISPKEELELEFREVLAHLGDMEQLEFFRSRLAGPDRVRALDALHRAEYIARAELADAVARFLSEAETPIHTSCNIEYSPAKYATEALNATFKTFQRFASENSVAYWQDWARRRAAGEDVKIEPQKPRPESGRATAPGQNDPEATRARDAEPPTTAPGPTPTASEPPSQAESPSARVWFGVAALAAILVLARGARLRRRR